MIITSDIYYQRDQIKCEDMGEDVQREGEKEDKYTKLWWKIKPKERDIQKHVLGPNGNVVLDLKEKWWVGMGVINPSKIGTSGLLLCIR